MNALFGAPKARKPYDYLVVGAGFAGSVIAERLASQHGARVLLIDRRDHVLIGRRSFCAAAFSTLASRWWSIKGPFFSERGTVLSSLLMLLNYRTVAYFLSRRRTIILLVRLFFRVL